jgi:hypothetical protein
MMLDLIQSPSHFAAKNIGYRLFGVLFGKSKSPLPCFTPAGIIDASAHRLEENSNATSATPTEATGPSRN